MLHRETIIALRARHTAFRIAMDILHPPQPSPPVPQPVLPLLEEMEGTLWTGDRFRRRKRLIAVALAVGLLLASLLQLYAAFGDPRTWQAPPPPPAGRPILP